MRFLKLLLLCAIVIVQSDLHAQLPNIRLTTVFPAGGRIGTSVEVAVSGADLDHVTGLVFSHEGISATPKLNEASKQPEPNRFVVTISTNVAPGVYEARVIGRFGISNPRAFVAGELEEVIESGTHQSLATAAELAAQKTLNGRADANAVDYFKLTLKQGQRVLIECLAKTIDSRMDASVLLLNAAGKDLARNRLGGLLDFTAPEDGPYFLKVHDFLFKGGGDYFYRLTVRSGPHIDFIFPPAGVPGTKSKFTLFGRNLPGGAAVNEVLIDGQPLQQLEVEIELPSDSRHLLNTGMVIRPAEASIDGFEYRLQTSEGASNPVLITFANDAVTLEQSGNDNDKPEAAQKISAPAEVAGQFYPANDRDWFTFEAKKGDVYWIEVFSHRLGLPTNPFLLVQRITKNDKGEIAASDLQEANDLDTNIGGNEFKTLTLDPAWRFEAKEDGAYRIEVRDLFNRTQNTPRLVYRLAIRKEAPDFRMVAMPMAPPPVNRESREVPIWTPLLRRGEALPVKVLVFRRDGFGGEIDLSADGLPAGVTCEGGKIIAGSNSGVLLLVAKPDAAGWAGQIRIVGKATLGNSEITREARAASVTWNIGDFNTEPVQSRLTRQFVLAVSSVESGAVWIEPKENKIWETSVAGKLQIPLKLVRRDGFATNLKLKAAGHPALEQVKEFDL
ncbi:MAG: hypothetical protein AB1813_25725, partial [Verrucomicrobiota bacterium]